MARGILSLREEKNMTNNEHLQKQMCAKYWTLPGYLGKTNSYEVYRLSMRPPSTLETFSTFGMESWICNFGSE